jgi:hypothetical protein
MVKKVSKKMVKKLWGGEIVVPRPSASASLTGRRQKYVAVLSVLNLVSDFVKCNHPISVSLVD